MAERKSPSVFRSLPLVGAFQHPGPCPPQKLTNPPPRPPLQEGEKPRA